MLLVRGPRSTTLGRGIAARYGLGIPANRLAQFGGALIIRFIAFLLPLVLFGGSIGVNAQEHVYCAQVQERYDDAYRRSRPQPVRQTTQQLLDEINTNALKDRLDDPAAARNGFLDRRPPVRTKDQRLVVKRMEVVYCQLIFSQRGQNEEAKLAQFNRVVKTVNSAEPFVPISTTREPTQASRQKGQIRLGTPAAFLMQAAVGLSGNIVLAEHAPAEESDVEFLAETPYFVNKTNKFFVIIASATSSEQGLRMMRQLKEAAPEYDFALYPPYLENPYYAVMSATWVSRDVAMDAHISGIQAAKRWLGDDFKPQRDNPFIWCYPYGPC